MAPALPGSLTPAQPPQPSQGRQALRAVAAPARQQRDSRRQPRPENVEGSFYVDHTCIGAPGACAPAGGASRQQQLTAACAAQTATRAGG